ncbi:MAG: hypothetical protein AB7E36_14650 [Salinivirgaceae bacterium]
MNKTREANMDFDAFLNKLHNHSKAIYENAMDEATENGRIINWLVGLAGGGLIFSFNQYHNIAPDNKFLVVFQFFVFVLIIVAGFLHKWSTSRFRSETTAIIRMMDFLSIEFALVPDDLISEIENEKLDDVFFNYLNGTYFQDEDEQNFKELIRKQTLYKRLSMVLTVGIVLLMLLQFSFFFVAVSR